MEWRLGDLTLDLAQPVGAGIVNVTVDSMFEGARSGTPEQAIADGARLARAGFDMLDVGAVAARSGPPVGVEDECAALIPAVAGMAALRIGIDDFGGGEGDGAAGEDEAGAPVPVSADTFQVEVARQALAAGAVCVNDISGGCEEMYELVAASGCGYVLMHIEGPPRVDRPWRDYGDVVAHLLGWFEARVERMRELGVAAEQIAIDPGLDFDLSPEQDLEVMRRLGELRALGLPLYVSLSRKDFIGAVLAGSWEERRGPSEREWGTVAATTLAVREGADIMRIHDRSSLQAMRLAGAVRDTSPVRSQLPTPGVGNCERTRAGEG
ncbi:MAG: dihydropteroate synthase [Actinobacteria bacterium]|nr:dihydropteroate synthase [Actinomycetota bacterium]